MRIRTRDSSIQSSNTQRSQPDLAGEDTSPRSPHTRYLTTCTHACALPLSRSHQSQSLECVIHRRRSLPSHPIAPRTTSVCHPCGRLLRGSPPADCCSLQSSHFLSPFLHVLSLSLVPSSGRQRAQSAAIRRLCNPPAAGEAAQALSSGPQPGRLLLPRSLKPAAAAARGQWCGESSAAARRAA